MPVESETVAVGSPAPDFELASIDGQDVSLSGLKGRAIVLVFLRGFG
jgi:peroxiredoxin